jgi:DNA-directed RNA polymerase specialized sigma24 family protein
LCRLLAELLRGPAYLLYVEIAVREFLTSLESAGDDVKPTELEPLARRLAAEFQVKLDAFTEAFEPFAAIVRAVIDDELEAAEAGLRDELEKGVWTRIWYRWPGHANLENLAAEQAGEVAHMARLILRHLQGSGELYNHLDRFVRRVVGSICRSRPELFDDVHAEVWLRIHRELDPTRASTLEPWIRQVAIHVFYDELRGTRRFIPAGDPMFRDDEAGGADPFEFAPVFQPSAAELSELFEFAFGGNIPPHQLFVFALVHLLGYKAREIEREFAKTPFDVLAGRILDMYSGGILSLEDLEKLAAPTLDELKQPVGVVLRGTAARSLYAHLRGRRCGETRFCDYDTGYLPTRLARWLLECEAEIAKAKAKAPSLRIRVVLGKCLLYKTVVFGRVESGVGAEQVAFQEGSYSLDKIAECAAPKLDPEWSLVRGQLRRRLGDLDGAEVTRYPGMKSKAVGDTVLSAYQSVELIGDLHAWTFAVKRILKEQFI